METRMNIQYGWICCKCESVMSPNSPQCWNCKPKIPEPVIPGSYTPTPMNETLKFCEHQVPLKMQCTSCIQKTRAHGIKINDNVEP